MERPGARVVDGEAKCMKTAGTHFPTFPRPSSQYWTSSGCPWRRAQPWDTSGWILQRRQCQLHLRSYNNHQAVAKHADPDHEICHWQPVFQPANCPLVVVVAIKECWVFNVALEVKQKKSCVSCAVFFCRKGFFKENWRFKTRTINLEKFLGSHSCLFAALAPLRDIFLRVYLPKRGKMRESMSEDSGLKLKCSFDPSLFHPS